MARSRRISKYLIPIALIILVTITLSCDEETGPGISEPNEPDTTSYPDDDTTSPQPVSDPSLTYSLAEGKAYLEWTAPSDDDPGEPVTRYEIRYSYTPYFELYWDLGIIHPAPPPPGQPGETDQVVITTPRRGEDLYAGIRAYDEAGNASTVNEVAFVHIPGYTLSGQCLNALTGQPIPGLMVRVTANFLRDITTDAEGRFSSDDLKDGAAYVSIKTGQAAFEVHPQVKDFHLSSDRDYIFYCIPLLPMESPHFDNLLYLFKALTDTFDSSLSTVLKTWKKRPVECYVPEFVNSYGVDYKAAVLEALQRWEDKAEAQLFNLVSAPPDTGIVFRYRPKSDMGILVGYTRHVYDDDGHPLIDEVNILDNATVSPNIYRIFLHEIGHTIQFDHVPYETFIMYPGQPLPPDISQDETDALKLLLSLPPRLNMANYDENYP